MAPAHNAATMSTAAHVRSRRRRREVRSPAMISSSSSLGGGSCLPDFGESFLVLPGQRPLSGVGRTLLSPAVGPVHHRNATAATPRGVGAPGGAAGQGRLVNARSGWVARAVPGASRAVDQRVDPRVDLGPVQDMQGDLVRMAWVRPPPPTNRRARSRATRTRNDLDHLECRVLGIPQLRELLQGPEPGGEIEGAVPSYPSSGLLGDRVFTWRNSTRPAVHVA